MHINGVLRVYHPRHAKAVPLLVDSPHSGRVYPDDFRFTCPREALQCYEDRFVDLLLSNLPHRGITVLQAEAPRCYIDLNRGADDIASSQIEGGWHGPFDLKPTSNCNRGTGLIWTHADETPIYNKRLSCEAVLSRIETHYWPYYAALEREAARIRERFGHAWHINMHSMPPHTNNGVYDVVLGDLDGRSCAPAFTNVVEKAFEAFGLRVIRNKPYKGANLTRTLGTPENGQESLQVEISKALYLKDDLITLDRDKFTRLQGIIDRVMLEASDFARSQIQGSNTSEKQSFKAASKSFIETLLPKAARDVTP